MGEPREVPTAPCLSLWQPWASLLVQGAKRIETRSWPLRGRGRLLVHAAKYWDASLLGLCVDPLQPFRAALLAGGLLRTDGGPVHDYLPFGAVIGQVEVIDCVPITDVRTEWDYPGGEHLTRPQGPGLFTVPPPEGTSERAFGDYTPGRHAILTANPVRFQYPIRFKGHQGLFNVPLVHLPEEYR